MTAIPRALVAGGLIAASAATAEAGTLGVGAADSRAMSLAANPALAVGADGTEIAVELQQRLAWIEYRRAPYDGTDPVSDPDRTFDPEERFMTARVPFFAVRTELRRRAAGATEPARWGLGASVSVPYGSGVEFSADGPGRYHMIRATSYAVYVAPVVALRAGPNLRLGAGPVLAVALLSARLRTDIAPNLNELDPQDPPRAPETGLLEGEFRIDDPNGIAPTVTAGFLYEPGPRWRFGASYTAGTFVEQRGRSRFTPSLDFNVVSDAGFTYLQYLPPVAHAGARWRPDDAVELSLEAGWIGWSTNSVTRSKVAGSRIRATQEDLEALLDALEINESSLVELLDKDQTSLRGYHDGWTVVLGGALANGRLRPRGEVGFTRNTVPDAYMNVGNMDFDAWILTAGATWAPEAWPATFGLSMIQYFPRDRRIESSRFRSDAPVDSGFAYPTGNGVYRARSMRFSLTTSVRF